MNVCEIWSANYLTALFYLEERYSERFSAWIKISISKSSLPFPMMFATEFI